MVWSGFSLSFVVESLVLLFACGSPHADSGHHPDTVVDWPRDVAPPFGLQDVKSGIPANEAMRLATLVPGVVGGARVLVGRIAPLSNHPDSNYVALDSAGRVGDVVIATHDCTVAQETLVAHWGKMTATTPLVASVLGNAVGSWYSEATGWEATLSKSGAGCFVSFLHRDYFGDPMSVPPSVIASKNVKDGELSGVREIRVTHASGSEGDRDGYGMTFSQLTMVLLKSRWHYRDPEYRDADWHDSATRTHISLRCPSITKNDDDVVCHLWYAPYVPMESLLGTDDKIAAISMLVLGTEIAGVKASYGDKFSELKIGNKTRYGIFLPGTEWDDYGRSFVSLTVEGGIVVGLEIETKYDRQQMLTLLEKKWGTGTTNASGVVFTSRAYGPVQVEFASNTGVTHTTIDIGKVD